MFPGDTLLGVTNLATLEHASFLSALINAVIYGLIAWAVFVFAMKRIESGASREPAKRHKRRK